MADEYLTVAEVATELKVNEADGPQLD